MQGTTDKRSNLSVVNRLLIAERAEPDNHSGANTLKRGSGHVARRIHSVALVAPSLNLSSVFSMDGDTSPVTE